VGAKLLQYSTVMAATPKELSATTVTAERLTPDFWADIYCGWKGGKT